MHNFAKEDIPLRGAVGQHDWVAPTPDTIGYLQSIFRTSPALQPSHIDEGMRVLRQLQSRLDVFQGADDNARMAMRQWCARERGVGDDDPYATLTALFAGTACLKSCELAEVQKTINSLSKGKTAEEAEEVLEAIREYQDRIEQLVEEVNTDAAAAGVDPQAITFDRELQATEDELAAIRRKRLHSISKVLFEKHKFRQKPFEWVYDGLSPVLLHDVLESRSGLSILLATIYVSVAAHLSPRYYLVMAPVPKTPNAASLAGSLISRTAVSATAPTPLDWMVYAPGMPMLRIDPLNKGSITEVSPSDPVHQVLQARPAFHMAVYAELARIMMIAHQRRGESDDVAHWMWQVMALDHRAPEWDIFEQQ